MENETVKINLKTASIVSIVMLIVPIAIGLLIQFFFFKSHFAVNILSFIIMLIGLVVLTVLHELLHGLAFIISGASPRDLKFGVMPKMMAVYCSCKKPLKIGHYIFVLALPTIILGIIPYILSVIFLSPFYVVLFSIMISGGAGDLLMLIKASKYNMKQLVLDHPSEPAFIILNNPIE